jgi:hypothetical protein
MAEPIASLVRVSWTGKGQAERCSTIPITRAAGQKVVPVISFGPGKDVDTSLPSLQPGDRLEIAAEVEVTTDLTPRQAIANAKGGGKPTGVPYGYAPAVSAQLLLTKSPDIALPKRDQAIAIGRAQRIKLSHDQHHAVLVFDGAADGSVFQVPKGGIPWGPQSYVNLAIDASHPSAASGNVLLVGQNEFDGTVEGDMGAICALRFRPGSQAEPKALTTSKLVSSSLSMQTMAKRVVYSMPLEMLKANEQLRVRAAVDTTMKGAAFPARVKVRVFLAESPGQEDPSEGETYVGQVASSRGQVTKGNGFNCMPGLELTRYKKVGVLRMLKSSDRKLYLNVVASSGNPDKVTKPIDVGVLRSGYLSVTRYPPGCCG